MERERAARQQEKWRQEQAARESDPNSFSYTGRTYRVTRDKSDLRAFQLIPGTALYWKGTLKPFGLVTARTGRKVRVVDVDSREVRGANLRVNEYEYDEDFILKNCVTK